MNAIDREQLCRQAVADKRRLGLHLGDVRRIDAFLRQECGIIPPLTPSSWTQKLRRLAGRQLAATYRAVYDEYAGFLEAGAEVPLPLQTEFYDILADNRIAGHIHSQKRTEILDAGCLLLYLVRLLSITGPILDIGCHTGHHAIMLARETNVVVHGIDLSSKAIDAAKVQAAGCANLAFSTDPLSTSAFAGMFEMVYAVRSIDIDEHSAELVAAALKPGGVAVFFPQDPPVFSEEESAAIHRSGLGWVFADLVGGWIGADRGFEAGSAVVLIKCGGARPPEEGVEEATSGWAAFHQYANSPSTTDAEKTQAYFRAHWQAQHPPGT